MTNKIQTAILVVSFGTSYTDTREKTLDLIEADIAEAYPARKIYKAYTSTIIIRKLKERDGLHIPTVTEALEQMKSDGITDVVIQPTHVINGIENDQMKADIDQYRKDFSRIRIGDPLLTSEEDLNSLVTFVEQTYEDLDPDNEVLVMMGHGTPHYANTVYAALDYILKEQGLNHIYIGTVEAYPGLDTVMKLIRAKGVRKIILAPLMIVAGDHAVNDLAGAEADSWRSRFLAEGYEVECRITGLGEYEAIRRQFIRHIENAS